VELQGSTEKYSGATGKYREVQWSYREVQLKDTGVQGEYGEVQWNYVLQEYRFLLLKSNPSQGTLVDIYFCVIE
jgi:hypothetical protein